MRKLPLIAAASLALASPALAQNTATTADSSMTTADPTMTDATTPVQDDDDDFPWGLLGLLGLAGLLPRKRHDHVVHTNTADTNHKL